MTDCVFCGNEAVFVDGDPKMCYTCNEAWNSGFEYGYKFKFDKEKKE